MAAAVPIRSDYDAAPLRELAKRSEDADQTRRLLALAVIYDGGSRSEAAKLGGVGLQTVRDWVLAFILDHCCRAWNKLVAQPWTITSIGLRQWAHRS